MINFLLAAILAVSFLGTDGADKVGHNDLNPDGSPDFHISASGLSPLPINQIHITSDNGGIWEMPFNGTNWVIQTQLNGNNADFYFDSFGSANNFTVVITYSDGSQQTASTNAPPPPPPQPPPVGGVPDGTVIGVIVISSGQTLCISGPLNLVDHSVQLKLSIDKPINCKGQ